MIVDTLYKNLIDALKLVAAPADVQIQSLAGYENAAEEITLIFTDAYIAVPQLVVHNRVSEDVASLIEELEEQFESITSDERLLRNEQLGQAQEWKMIREAAMKILKEMNESI